MLFFAGGVTPPGFLGGFGVGERFTLSESRGRVIPPAGNNSGRGRLSGEGENLFVRNANRPAKSLFGFARPAGPDHGPKEDNRVEIKNEAA